MTDFYKMNEINKLNQTDDFKYNKIVNWAFILCFKASKNTQPLIFQISFKYICFIVFAALRNIIDLEVSQIK